MKYFTILLVSMLISQYTKSQDLLKLSTGLYNAYDELSKAYETFDKVQNIVKQIENGGTPDVNSYGDDWHLIADNYLSAAASIKNAPLITDFNSAPYSVSIIDLNNCYLRDQNFTKLNGFNIELNNAVARGQNELLKITDFKNLIKVSEDALNYLTDVNAKLAEIPIYNEIFQWNWFELETAVKPALAELSTSLNNQEKKLTSEIEKIKQQASNLQSNIALLQNSLCLIQGTYSQSLTIEDEPVTIKLTIIKNGNSYNGTLIVIEDGEPDSENISLIFINSGKYISFTDEYNDKYFGELSPDYKEIRNFKIEGDNMSFSLRK